MIEVNSILKLQDDMVVRWHDREEDRPHEGIYGIICEQHSFNFKLWHQEDIARSPELPDGRIAQVKRTIDGLNQQRNDWIEKIDEWILANLSERRISAQPTAPLNTETPGSVIDRLSILSLRLYHLAEQTHRPEAAPDLLASLKKKLTIGLAQREDLSDSLADLIDDIYDGNKRHKTYRQMKMYNDSRLNPYIYEAKLRKAS